MLAVTLLWLPLLVSSQTVLDSDLYTDDNNDKNSDLVEKRQVDAFRVVKNPLVCSSDTMMKVPTHFYRGCSYTLSLWVFLYRQSNFQNERVIFSSSILSGTHTGYKDEDGIPSLELPPQMLPSIITGVGSTRVEQESFFISIGRDHSGQYHGFWALSGPKVPYEEWFYVAMDIHEDNTVAAFIDHEPIGTVQVDYVTGPEIQYNGGVQQRYLCPYNYAVGTLAPQPHSALSDYANNTALSVLNQGSTRVTGTSGMVQEFIVLRNKVASPEERRTLASLTRPASSDFLTHLLRSYGHFSLQGFNARYPDYNGGLARFYLELTWGMCPQVVCGVVCMSPQFLLGIKSREVYYYYGGLNDTGVEDGVRNGYNQEVAAHGNLPAVRRDGLRRASRSSIDFAEEGLNIRKRDQPGETLVRVTHSMEKKLVDKALYLATALLRRFERYFGYSISSITQSSRGGNNPESVGAEYGPSPNEEKDAQLSGVGEQEVLDEHENPLLSNLTSKEIWRRRRQRSVQDLYHCGMVWLHGKHYSLESRWFNEEGEMGPLMYDTGVCDWLLMGRDDGDICTRRPHEERRRALERALRLFPWPCGWQMSFIWIIPRPCHIFLGDFPSAPP